MRRSKMENENKMKKKIVFAVYHNVNSEARSKEFLECCTMLGEVDFVSYALPVGFENVRSHIIDKKSPFALIHFLQTAMKTIDEIKPDIVVLHDNDCSVLVPRIKKKHPNVKIVYDSSELYIKAGDFKKKRFFGTNGMVLWLKSTLSKFRPICEKKYLKNADLVFAANIERANIMKDYFQLKSVPLVFDNMHRIYDEYDEDACKEKFNGKIIEGKFNILFGGGISEERQTFDYINAFLKLGEEYNLVIAGTASAVAYKKYEELLKNTNANNIFYIGFISRAELRYCMQKVQASVVVFAKDSYNTLYCASGKLYESLFEGCPILCSENPPLKRLCESYGIGISSDHFDEAAKRMSMDYQMYRANVRQYTLNLKYEERVTALADTIKREIL